MKIKHRILQLMLKALSILPIQKKVVFSSYFGVSYGGSPAAIFKYMKEHYPNFKYVWLMKNVQKKISGAETIGILSFSSLYHYATAKVWVDNTRKPEWVVKRNNQFYIQTWHGSLALKKIEKDAEENLSAFYVRCAKHDSQMADAFLSASDWSTKNYLDAFWYDGPVLKYGLPRSDIYFKEKDGFHDKVCSYYSIPKDSKIILYAPTFREDGNIECYDIDYNKLLHVISDRFSGNWKLIIRLHPNVQTKASHISYSDCILNGSEYDDINELLMASDFLITDYSSCMFDAILAKTPVFLYASDIDTYNKERGTYFSFNELPFSLAINNEQLFENILSFNAETYNSNVSSFKNKCGFYDKGDASEKVSNMIANVIDN